MEDEESSMMQEIESEGSTMGRGHWMHALNDDDLATEESHRVHSLPNSFPGTDTVISMSSVVTDDVAVSTNNSTKELQPIKEYGHIEEDGGYANTLMRVSLKLVSEKYPSEIRRHGVKILLHLMRFRWEEISITECGNHVIGSKRAIATLVAEIAWSHVSLLHDLIPCLVSISAKGACEAELVCFMLRSISNVGITHDALLKVDDRGEMLLHGLGEFLPQVLPLLCSLLDKHTRGSCSETSKQHTEVSKQHECTVKAALYAAHAYAGWTPVTDLARYGLIQRCGSLLRSNIFRTDALQFFKSILQSKRPVGIAIAEYDAAVSYVFPILMNISEGSLKFIEPELQCLKALYPSLGYHTVNAKAVDKLFELLESVPATSEDFSGVSACIAGHSMEFNDYVSPRKLDISEEMGCHLFEEHNILSEAFTFIASCPWFQNDTGLLYCILFPLSKIWSQPQWEISLMHYFCNAQFRTSVHNIALLFKEELKNYTSEKSNGIGPEGKSSYRTLTTLLPLMLPQLLKVLQFVHSLWTDEVAANISEDLEGAKSIMCSVESSDLENEIRVWLQNIRKIGYMIIGNCSYLEGAFHNLLDSPLIYDSLIKNLESMEFRHLTWLIKYTIIPLVKNCPSGLWTKWIDMLLKPVFHYCEYPLYSSWCNLLYGNTVCVPDDFGDTLSSKEEIDKLGMDLMFKLTREVSNLLAVIALPKLNRGIAHGHQSMIQKVATSEDVESTLSGSLVGYLLHHDGINDSILRLIAYLFDYWTDGVARSIAVPFCYSLIRLATVTHSDKLISFVKDDFIPTVVRRLAFEPGLVHDSDAPLRSDIDNDRHSLRSESGILTDLCHNAYRCIQEQGLVGEGTFHGNNADIFKKWLSEQVEMVRTKKEQAEMVYRKNESVDELEEFVWIREIEEEFISYLPTYTAMLHKVDAFANNLKGNSYLWSSTELVNEFVSKNVVDDSDLLTVSSILLRKLSSEHRKRRSKQMYKLFCELISFDKPYIKYSMGYSGCDEGMQTLIRDNPEWSTLDEYTWDSTLEFFCSILETWEPQFHPLIRKGHKDVLMEVASRFLAEYIEFAQSFQPESADFPAHLQPYAQNYINEKNKKKGYDRAKEQLKLHQQFDEQLASGALDPYIRQVRCSKGDLLRNTLDIDILGTQFSDLDHVLCAMSLERRAKLLEEEHRLCLYSKHMEVVIVNEQLINGLRSLIGELEAESFFLVDDDIEWGKKRFSELVDKFEEDVFGGLHLPKHYVIRGIMDLRRMLRMEDITLKDAFEAVVRIECMMWRGGRDLFWMDTRYYEHDYYSIIEDPLKEIWTEMEGRKEPVENVTSYA